MPPRRPPKRAVTLDGLYFPPGRPFSSMAAAERIYGLLLGNNFWQGNQTVDEVRPQVVMILSAIFNIALSRVPTFVALKDSDVGWQIVAGTVAEQHKCEIPPADLEEMVRVFAGARRDYLCGPRLSDPAPATPTAALMDMMDKWNDAVGQGDRAADVSSEVSTLAARPAPPAPLENLLAGFGLRDDGPSAPPSATTTTTTASGTPWPPSHLAPADVELLKHPRVQAQLAGVTWRDKGKMPALPDEKTDPLGLRVWLGWLAAAHTPPPPQNFFTLFAAPVAFLTNKERQLWYDASGCQSKMFGHVDGFLAYAADAFHAGKTMVLGLFTPVFVTPAETEAIADARGEPVAEVFNNHSRLRRFGTAVMIRLVERNGTKGVQVAFFCPWDQHKYIKESWKRHDWRLLLWKDKVIKAVDAWAAEHKVVVHEGYSGGSIWVRDDNKKHDSVEMCAGWLLRAVTATKKTIPSDKEEDEWEWEEVCYFMKLQNWVPLEEEQGGQMDVDTYT